jgi:hypothetical protein
MMRQRSTYQNRCRLTAFAFLLASCVRWCFASRRGYSDTHSGRQSLSPHQNSLSVPATFVLLAAGASIVRAFSFSAWLAYGSALVAAIGSRHLNAIFAAWPPAGQVIVEELIRSEVPPPELVRNAIALS